MGYLPLAVAVFLAATTGADLIARTSIAAEPLAFALREQAAQRALVEDLLRMWREGTIRPPVHRTYALDETVQALEDVAQRRVMGKAVITP